MSSLLKEHIDYLSDTRRLELFRQATQVGVQPADRVVDAGCGTAVLGLLCLQAGAGHVVAIDSTDVIEVARESLHRAGWDGRFTCLQGSTFDLRLEESADLVVCDHVGYFGFDYGLIEIMCDARRRFLRPGGRLMPRRLRLFVAAVHSPRLHEKAVAWRAPGIPPEYHWLAGMGANMKQAVRLQSNELASEPVMLTEIDLQQDQPAFFSWPYELQLTKATAVHGLVGWFECELAEGVWMTNSPGCADAIDRPQAFFPVAEPVSVKQGESLQGTVMARPAEHLIAWTIRHPVSGVSRRGSTWESEVLPKDRLHSSKGSHVPVPNWRAGASACVLALCDGERSVEQIRNEVLARYPDLLPSTEAIRQFVDDVLTRNTD